MANKPISKKSKSEPIWSDNDWSVVYGELKRPPGRPYKTKPLFKCVGEKIPFKALGEIEKQLEEKDITKQGVYIAHDSMGTARYVGRGDNVFSRLKKRKKAHPNELTYFSFFIVVDKQHEREVETLLIRQAAPVLEFNQKKKRVGISTGNVKDYEAGTCYFERQIKKGPKA